MLPLSFFCSWADGSSVSVAPCPRVLGLSRLAEETFAPVGKDAGRNEGFEDGHERVLRTGASSHQSMSEHGNSDDFSGTRVDAETEMCKRSSSRDAAASLVHGALLERGNETASCEEAPPPSFPALEEGGSGDEQGVVRRSDGDLLGCSGLRLRGSRSGKARSIERAPLLPSRPTSSRHAPPCHRDDSALFFSRDRGKSLDDFYARDEKSPRETADDGTWASSTPRRGGRFEGRSATKWPLERRRSQDDIPCSPPSRLAAQEIAAAARRWQEDHLRYYQERGIAILKHTVKETDTLYSIAMRYNVAPQEVRALNMLRDYDDVWSRSIIRVPRRQPSLALTSGFPRNIDSFCSHEVSGQCAAVASSQRDGAQGNFQSTSVPGAENLRSDGEPCPLHVPPEGSVCSRIAADIADAHPTEVAMKVQEEDEDNQGRQREKNAKLATNSRALQRLTGIQEILARNQLLSCQPVSASLRNRTTVADRPLRQERRGEALLLPSSSLSETEGFSVKYSLFGEGLSSQRHLQGRQQQARPLRAVHRFHALAWLSPRRSVQPPPRCRFPPSRPHRVVAERECCVSSTVLLSRRSSTCDCHFDGGRRQTGRICGKNQEFSKKTALSLTSQDDFNAALAGCELLTKWQRDYGTEVPEQLAFLLSCGGNSDAALRRFLEERLWKTQVSRTFE